jgi:hypothetical protein
MPPLALPDLLWKFVRDSIAKALRQPMRVQMSLPDVETDPFDGEVELPAPPSNPGEARRQRGATPKLASISAIGLPANRSFACSPVENDRETMRSTYSVPSRWSTSC